MIYLMCALYYILAVIGIVMRWRFRRFSFADFQYNKALNRQRTIWLLYSWALLILSGVAMGSIKVHKELQHIGFLISSLAIMIIYVFIIDFF